MSIDFEAEMKLKCSDYLHVIYKGKEVNLEEYISICNKKKIISFTHGQLANCSFVYRGKKYTYFTLCKNNIAETELPVFYNDDVYNKELFGCFSVECGCIIRLIETIDRYLNKARFETIKSATILDIDFMNADYSIKNYTWQYKQRCFYAENAIYSYCAVLEILMLIIWIGKGYHNSLRKLTDICEEFKMSKLLCNLKNDDPQMMEIFANVDLAIKPAFREVRNWCNKFKHRGILRFEGEKRDNELQRYVQIRDEGNSQGESTFSNKDYSYEYIDLDKEVIPALKTFHNEFIKIAKQVIAKFILET